MLRMHFLTKKLDFLRKVGDFMKKRDFSEIMWFSSFGPKIHRFDLGKRNVSCKVTKLSKFSKKSQKYFCTNAFCVKIFSAARFLIFTKNYSKNTFPKRTLATGFSAEGKVQIRQGRFCVFSWNFTKSYFHILWNSAHLRRISRKAENPL